MHAPLVQMTGRNPKLAGKLGGALPSVHPLDRRELELSAEFSALSFGHRSPLENCPLFLCLILGVHSNPAPIERTMNLQIAAVIDAAVRRRRMQVRLATAGRNSRVSISRIV